MKYLNDSKAFIEYSNDADTYKKSEGYNPSKKRPPHFPVFPLYLLQT